MNLDRDMLTIIRSTDSVFEDRHLIHQDLNREQQCLPASDSAAWQDFDPTALNLPCERFPKAPTYGFFVRSQRLRTKNPNPSRPGRHNAPARLLPSENLRKLCSQMFYNEIYSLHRI